MSASQGTRINSALPKIIMPTGSYFESVKSLLTVLYIFCPVFVCTVTALSAANATPSLFMIAISAVMIF